MSSFNTHVNNTSIHHTHTNKIDLDGITNTLISNWNTAFGWGNHALTGYLTSETDPTVGNHIKAITATNITNWNSAYTHSTSEHQNIINGTGFVKASGKTLSYDNNTYALNSALSLHTEDNVKHHTHTNKTIIDQFSQSNLDVLSKLSLVNGKLQISVDAYSIGELSAYGASGGGGGSGSSYSRLDAWAAYDATKAGWVLSALLGNDLNTRVSSLESGLAAYTAADVLTKLKTVDGSGSGLDADLLDGFHAGGVSGAYWSKIPVVGADGVMEVGAYLDFHEANTGTSNYDGRLSSVGTAAFWNGNRMWHAANSNLSTIDWTAKNITVATDIITNFNTWTNGNSKSLDKFLKLFDIDTAGNLVVKTNLYSTGEVTAYSSGTGISGLTLMGNLNANSKNINNVLNINAQQLNTSKVLAGVLQIGNNPTGEFPNCVGLFGYRDDEVATYMNLIATYKENTGEYIYANNLFVVDSAGQATATSFKFGNWTFKEVSGNMVISYNGTAKATIQSSRTNSNL